MGNKKIYLAMNDAADSSLLESFFQVLGISLDHLTTLNSSMQFAPDDLMFVDLYFESQHLLEKLKQIPTLPSKTFLLTPKVLNPAEEDLVQKLNLIVLKKPLNFDLIYNRILDHLELS